MRIVRQILIVPLLRSLRRSSVFGVIAIVERALLARRLASSGTFDISNTCHITNTGFLSTKSFTAFACFFSLVQGVSLAEDDRVDYVTQVKPLLKSRCYTCHGALKHEGGLRLDTAAQILQGGDSGKAISPGESAASSLLLKRVSAADVSVRMPPEHEGEPFNAEEIILLQKWIAAGAAAPADETPESDPKEHWSFRPIARPEEPSVKNAAWVRNPIDAFIASGHALKGLVPQPEAPRIVLLRRLSVDLIGLPPTAEEIAQFEADTSAEWYENIVDRLLDDPRHGERWARHWMDIWRYSDWWGLGDQLRNSDRHMWRWRDWIVESLNEDTPYDKMVQLMLAADELTPDDPDMLRATGFLVRNFYIFNRNRWMEDTVEHVSKGFLGLTMNCCKCHDHKFDPLSQVDYYKMRAFFEPYLTRIDMVPGETDLNQNGIPRVFDGLADVPTYRFIRGDDAQPDKSKVISPGVPGLFAFDELQIQPVELPESAWQPGLQDWVLENHIAAARQRLQSAESKESAVVLQKVDSDPTTKVQGEIELAKADVKVALAELNSVECRAEAIRAQHDNVEQTLQHERKVAAIQSERRLALARAESAMIAAEQARQQATDAKKEEAQKKIDEARTRLSATKAVDAEIKPEEMFTPLTGARWTATRFKNTGADDPHPKFGPQSTGRRLALAKWITDRRNPLTARVAVNHLWNRHFGVALAPAPFDLGRNSPVPAHPLLIDWLASEFMNQHWSMKHLHRLIVTSATYRMSSSVAGAEHNLAKDPDNRYWWRRTPIRLESQAVRDSILSLSGTLDPTKGGPSVPSVQQADSKRRSLYFFHSNNERNLFLSTFDEAEVGECYRREQSIVPQQALAMTNSRLVLDSSGQIADRISEKSTDDTDFVKRAFTLVLGIHPTEAEIAISLKAMGGWNGVPNGSVRKARSNLIWVLMNHNDFVTLR